MQPRTIHPSWAVSLWNAPCQFQYCYKCKFYKAFPFNTCLVSHIFSYKPWKPVLASCDIFHFRDLCPAYWSVKLCTSNQPGSVWVLSWMCTLNLLLRIVFASLWTSAVRFMPNSFAFRPLWRCKWDASASLPCFHVPCKSAFFSRGRWHSKLNATIFFSCHLHFCDILLNLIGMPLVLHYLKEIPAVFPVHPNNWKACHATASFNDMHHHSLLL